MSKTRKPAIPAGGAIGSIPAPPEGEYLSAEDIATIAKEREHEYRWDTPEGETPICAYCGAETKQRAFTHLPSGRSYPPCCHRCLEKWDSVPS